MARYIGYLWCCVVGLFSLNVHAASCFVGGGKYFTDFANAAQAAAQASCTQFMAGSAIIVTLYPPPYAYGIGATYKCTGNSTERWVDVTLSTQPTCSGDPVVCTAGSVLGTGSTRWTYQGDYPGFGGYCINGCSYALYGSEGYDKTSNMSAATGYMKASGETCSGTNTPKTSDSSVTSAQPSTAPTSSTPDLTACKPGQVPYTGTVNGKTVTVCGAPSKTSGTQTETTSNSSSTTTNNNGTQTTSTTNTGDSKTTKTTCENGTCTTTTTSSSSSGGGSGTSGGSSSSGTQTKTESQESFCKSNPQALVCKQQDESSFGGSCGAFSCSGDAVQCAQARAAHDLLCEVKLSDTDPNVIAGKAGAAGGLVPGDHPGANGQTQAFALSSMLDSTPLFGTSGDCIADKTVPMMGQTLTLPFSRMCGALELLGNAFLAACFLAAGMIVFRT